MKNYKLLLSLLASSAAMLMASVASADTMEKQGVITIIRVQGTAEYSVDGGHAWVPIVVGKQLQAGTLVHTGPASSADLLVGKTTTDQNVQALQYKATMAKNPGLVIPAPIERNIIRLRPDTTLGIDKLTMNPGDFDTVSDTELDLKKGHLFASVKKVSPSSEYLIKIPNGVAAVRGTALELGVDDKGTHCAVSSGTVWISITLTSPDGSPITGPDGKPFPPLQLTLNPGQSLALTAALINSLGQKVANAIGGNGLTKAVNTAVVDILALEAAITAEAESSAVSDTSVTDTAVLTSNILNIQSEGGNPPVVVTITASTTPPQTTTPGGNQ